MQTKCPGLIPELFQPIDWNKGFVTAYKTQVKNKTRITINLKLTVGTESFSDAALDVMFSMQARHRDFQARLQELEQQLVDEGLVEQLGYHDQMIALLHQHIVRSQSSNARWDRKFVRFGIARKTRKHTRHAGYEPLIPGVIAAFDPGSHTLAFSINGLATHCIQLDRDVSDRQRQVNITGTKSLHLRQPVYSADEESAGDRLRRHLAEVQK